MFEWVSSPEAWIALGTLTALEIVLGIDNIVFISILTGRLPRAQQGKAQKLGLALALLMRLGLLLAISWIMGLTEPLFVVLGKELTGRALILLGGGLFLIAKSTLEIHSSLEGISEEHTVGITASFLKTVIQIGIIDIIFSLDSVITAVGLVNDVEVMIAAVVVAVLVMMWASGPISDFVDRHPTMKMLALSFLVLVGFALMGEAAGLHIPKGYIYFAMAFSFIVEMLNLRLRKKTEPVQLHSRLPAEDDLKSL